MKKFEVLIFFGGVVGGMFIVLMVILIYGYKIWLKDSYYCDRDNDLYFWYVLFVVWFVGMRLVKSFFLILIVLFVIFIVIYYMNVKILEKYSLFYE